MMVHINPDLTLAHNVCLFSSNYIIYVLCIYIYIYKSTMQGLFLFMLEVCTYLGINMHIDIHTYIQYTYMHACIHTYIHTYTPSGLLVCRCSKVGLLGVLWWEGGVGWSKSVPMHCAS